MNRLTDWFSNLTPAKFFLLAISATFLIFLFTTLIPAVSNGNKVEEPEDNQPVAEETLPENKDEETAPAVDPAEVAAGATPAPAPVVPTAANPAQSKPVVQQSFVKKITTVTTVVSGGATKILKSIKFVKTDQPVATGTPLAATTSTLAPESVKLENAIETGDTSNGVCKLGKIKVSSAYAKNKVTFVHQNDKNVRFYHWSFGDPKSKPHASASGSRLSYTHTYDKVGTYTATVYGYASEADFKAGKPCASKKVTIKVKKQETGWVWPTTGTITSKVGMRVQPVTGVYRMHQGIDIKNSKGTKIVAARDGKVVATNGACTASRSNCGGGYGNYVVIKHSNGLYSIYAHLSKVNTKVGRTISAGQKIGEMGSTGLTTDVHLHFGIGPTLWVNQNVKNPLNLLPKR